MRRAAAALTAAVLLLLWGAGEAAAQSDAYMRVMRTQNQRMMNRARIYSAVRSGARVTRYRGGRDKKRAGGARRVVRRGTRR